jgi:hypothetical protein
MAQQFFVELTNIKFYQNPFSRSRVGFEVLTAASMTMAVFWVVNFYQTTRRYNPEDSHLLFSS